jgi:exopolysaccharide biosynthesis WecB/TagA/CpsF family protein
LARDTFARETPWHEFHIISDGYFKDADVPGIKKRLAALKPDILLVAMGVPRQEQFIAEQLGPEFCTMPMAIGALLDLHTGTIPRAPLWVRRLRSEWAYRLTQEPGRLWRRYIIGNPLFLYRVARNWLTGHSRESGLPQRAG